MIQKRYAEKLCTPENAVARIPEGATLIHGLTMAEPPALLAATAARLLAGDLKKLKVYSILPQKPMADTLLRPELADCVEANTWFVSGGDRNLVQVGLDYFIPSHFHQVPRLIVDRGGVDVAMTTVSPMDEHGFFTLGTANDYTSAAMRSARYVVVEVNRHMPRVFGDSLLHISEVHAVVENHQPLCLMPPAAMGPEDHTIGKTIAEMVPDGATIQLGWGGVPSAVGHYLAGHRDLGIHTEVFVPAMVELIEKGVVTGRKKALHPHKHVFTVAQGDQKMLDFMHDNPSVESYPVNHINHPAVIAQNNAMISINAILEVDLLGQCNAEFLAGRQFSGTGGQLDFVRGAYDSPGGKSILAFHSTAKQGTLSRIVPRLAEGAQVTTPRQDTHWLVTEHGAANLKGQNTRDRALAIIGLAHPDFRDDLLREADNMRLL